MQLWGQALDIDTTELLSLRHGDTVRTANGLEGWVIDRDEENRPVVYFPRVANGFARPIREDEYLAKIGEIPIQAGERRAVKADVFKMPLFYAKSIGFRLLAADRYEFQPTLVAKVYPWDRGGIWQVVESEGKQYLIKEEDTGTDNNPNENDMMGTTGPTSQEGPAGVVIPDVHQRTYED